MLTGTGLKNEIEITELLHGLFEAYEEIAVMQMKKLRGQVLSSRKFVGDVMKVSATTKAIYSQRVLNKLNSKAKLKPSDLSSVSFSTLNKNGKSLAIFISPRERFSGDIGYKVFESFKNACVAEGGREAGTVASSGNLKSDLMVLGFFGKQLMQKGSKNVKYKYYDFKGLSGPNFDAMIKDINGYEKVEVFFGKFENLLSQKATSLRLFENSDEVEKDEPIDGHPDFFFEPSIESVLYFFESEMIKAFIKQCLSESELSRLGSRMTAMEFASSNSTERIKSLNREKLIFVKAQQNKKQLESLAGMNMFSYT